MNTTPENSTTSTARRMFEACREASARWDSDPKRRRFRTGLYGTVFRGLILWIGYLGIDLFLLNRSAYPLGAVVWLAVLVVIWAVFPAPFERSHWERRFAEENLKNRRVVLSRKESEAVAQILYGPSYSVAWGTAMKTLENRFPADWAKDK